MVHFKPRWYLVSLVISLVAAFSPVRADEDKREGGTPTTVDKAAMQRVVQRARAYHVPMPSPKAKPVWITDHTSGRGRLGFQSVDGDDVLLSYAFELLVAPTDGTFTWRFLHEGKDDFEPMLTDANDSSRRFGLNRLDNIIAVAQAYALGHESMAQQIYSKILQSPFYSHYGPGVSSLKELSALDAFDHAIWFSMRQRVHRSRSHWQSALATLEPLIENNGAIVDDRKKAFVESLRLAVQWKSKETVSAFDKNFNALASEERTRDSFGFGREVEPEELAILELGLDAIPKLLGYVDDRRLSSTLQYYMRGPQRLKRVGELAIDLIVDISGDRLSSSWDKQRHVRTIDKNAVEAWLKEARAMGEAEYLASRIYEVKQTTNQPNIAVIKILAARHPERLISAYKDGIKNHPQYSTYEITDQILHAPLDQVEKIAAFTEVVGIDEFNHSVTAWRALNQLAPQRAADLLIGIIRNFDPSNVEVPFPSPMWSPTSSLQSLVLGCDDDRIWNEYERMVWRLASKERHALFGSISDCEHADWQLVRLAQLLLPFLQDTSTYEAEPVPNIQELMKRGAKPEEMHKAMMQQTMAMGRGRRDGPVRVQAAAGLARLLKLEDHPQDDSADAVWQSFEVEVKQAIEQRVKARSE